MAKERAPKFLKTHILCMMYILFQSKKLQISTHKWYRGTISDIFVMKIHDNGRVSDLWHPGVRHVCCAGAGEPAGPENDNTEPALQTDDPSLSAAELKNLDREKLLVQIWLDLLSEASIGRRNHLFSGPWRESHWVLLSRPHTAGAHEETPSCSTFPLPPTQNYKGESSQESNALDQLGNNQRVTGFLCMQEYVEICMQRYLGLVINWIRNGYSPFWQHT